MAEPNGASRSRHRNRRTQGGGHGLPASLARSGYASWADVAVTWLVGGGFTLVAVVLLFSAPMPSASELVLVGVLTALFVVAFRTEFSRTYGSTVATEPILLALALCAPLHWVPAAIAVGVFTGMTGQADPRSMRLNLLRLGLGANCLGLVVVVWALGMTWQHWTWQGLALAYLAQTSVDAIVGTYRASLQGAPMRMVAVAMAWTIIIDGLLGIIGMAIISISEGRLPGLLILAVPILLIWMLSRDRQATYEEAKTLESAFSEVTEQARLDPLTGLANRRVWEEAVAAASAPDGSTTGGCTVTALLADLDHLKLANDTFGHEAGDQLLIELAWILTEASPENAVVARIGGDEFGILVVGEPGETPPDLISSVQAHIATHAEHTELIGKVTLSASLGQASAPPCRTVSEAIVRADHASRLDKFMRRARRQDHELTPS